MSIDPIDRACDREQHDRELCIEHARRVAADIPVGEPGQCERCGDDLMRLVGGACAPCRTRYKLP